MGKLLHLADYWHRKSEPRVNTPAGPGTLAGLIPLAEEIARGRVGVILDGRETGIRYFGTDEITGLPQATRRE